MKIDDELYKEIIKQMENYKSYIATTKSEDLEFLKCQTWILYHFLSILLK